MKAPKLLDVVRSKPLNFKPEDSKLFEQEWKRQLSIPTTLGVNDVSVNSDIVFYRNFRLVDELNAYNPAFVNSGKLRLFVKTLRGKKIEVEEAAWIIDGWSHGYFHWMTETLSRLLIFVNDNSQKPVLIPLPDSYKKLEFVTITLKLLQAIPFYYSRTEWLKIKRLNFVPPVEPVGNFHPEIILQLRRFLLQSTRNSEKKPSKKIYISRKKALRRKVENEIEVESILRQFKIEIYCLEDLSFLEQIELLSQTDFLISNHGAGLTNMLFMSPHTRVLELRRENDSIDNCYFSLASALKLDYLYLLCKSSNNDHNADLVVNSSSLKNLLQQYCAR